MTLKLLYTSTLDRITCNIDTDQINDVNMIFKNYNLNTNFTPDDYDATANYDDSDEIKLTDDLLFTLWFELFFNTNSPCYTSIIRSASRGEEVADAFIFSTICELNEILDKHNHHYRLVPIGDKITKLHLTSKLL